MPPQVVTVKDSGKVAAALANEKAQRILDHLQKHEDATETQLAKSLAMPLSTVHYTMKVLKDAKLVLADQYSYSSRGKEVTHYRLNRNPIVIVQEEKELALLKAIVPAAVLAAGAAVTYELVRSQRLLTPDATVAMMEASPMVAEGAPTAIDGARTFAAEPAADLFAAKAAPMVGEFAPDTIATTGIANDPSVVPWFLAGVVSVLVLSFLVLLALRWWDRRQTA